MARVTDIIRRGNISQVAAQAPRLGTAWQALANISEMAAAEIKPAALEQAKEEGAVNGVYEDEFGNLVPIHKSLLGGDLAAAWNSAAGAKYVAQRTMDAKTTLAELRVKHGNDSAGFKKAADAYINSIRNEQGIPGIYSEEIALGIEWDANTIFNSLFVSENKRRTSGAGKSTESLMNDLGKRYLDLVEAGDVDTAKLVREQIEHIQKYRTSAPYIPDTERDGVTKLEALDAEAGISTIKWWLKNSGDDREVSDEDRAMIDSAMNNPAVDPLDRAKINDKLEGRLNLLDGRSIGDTLGGDTVETAAWEWNLAHTQPDEEDWMAKAGGALESIVKEGPAVVALPAMLFGSVRDSMKAPPAEPTGADVYLDTSGTDPNPEAMEGFKERFRDSNITPTPGAMFTATVIGEDFATKLFSADQFGDPNAPVEDVFDEKELAKIPEIEGMTLAQAKRWLERQATVKASDLAERARLLELIENPDVRKAATAALNARIDAKRKLEAAEKAEYDKRISEEDDSLTELEIVNNNRLSDDAQRILLKKLRDSWGLTERVMDLFTNMSDSSYVFNPNDTKTKNDVENGFAYLTRDVAIGSEEFFGIATEMIGETGIMPRQMFDYLRGTLTTGTPQEVAMALEYVGQVTELNDGVKPYQMYDGFTAIRNAMTDYEFLAPFRGAEGAAEYITELAANPPSDAVTDSLKQHVKNLDVADVVSFFDEKGLDVDLGTGDQEAVIAGDYERLFESAYRQTGDLALAKNRALTELATIYGPNTVTGSSRLMRYPPQNFYPASVTNPDWMSQQISDAVTEYVRGELPPDNLDSAVDRVVYGSDGRIRPDQISLFSDSTTSAEVHSGKPPSYQVRYMDDEGMIQIMPQRFYFEKPPEGSALDMVKLNEDRSRVNSATNLRLWREYMRDTLGYDEATAFDRVTKMRDQFEMSPPPGSN